MHDIRVSEYFREAQDKDKDVSPKLDTGTYKVLLGFTSRHCFENGWWGPKYDTTQKSRVLNNIGTCQKSCP